MSENLPAVQNENNIPMVDGAGLCPQNFDGLWRLSTVMAASGMMPKDLNTPESVFVCMNMGAELGLSPMASVQNISCINGRPVLWGDAMLGIVRASGVMFDFSEKFIGTFPNDDFRACCSCKRGSEDIVKYFSIEDAKAAGLWKHPQQGVTPWHKYPKRMLQMRARSWALRDGFGDILKGIQSREEYQEMDADTQYNEKTEIYETVTPEPEPVADIPEPERPSFQQLVDEQHMDEAFVPALDKYISFVCEAKGTTRASIEQTAALYFDRFWGSFEKWLDEKPVETGQNEQADPPADIPADQNPGDKEPPFPGMDGA